MGGSACKPDDKKSNGKMSKEEYIRRKLALVQKLDSYLFLLRIRMECWQRNPVWYRNDSLYFLDLAIPESKSLQSLTGYDGVNRKLRQLRKSLEEHRNIHDPLKEQDWWDLREAERGVDLMRCVDGKKVGRSQKISL